MQQWSFGNARIRKGRCGNFDDIGGNYAIIGQNVGLSMQILQVVIDGLLRQRKSGARNILSLGYSRVCCHCGLRKVKFNTDSRIGQREE